MNNRVARLPAPQHSAHWRRSDSRGFTLVELLTVLAIICVLALIAVPVFTRDTTEADFNKFVRHFAQDAVRARMESMSNREFRELSIPTTGTSYTFNSVFVPTGGGSNVTTVLRRGQAPKNVSIAGAVGSASVPDLGYVTFSGSGGLPADVRFSSIGNVQRSISGGALADGGATVYFAATVNGEIRYKARVVIYGTTGYSRFYDRW